MAIIYPLGLPAGARFYQCEFALDEVQAVNTKRSGEVLAVELADRLWRAKFVTTLCTPDQQGRWQSWRGSLNGSIGSFLVADPNRDYPLAYGAAVLDLDRAGGGAFDGTATLSAWTATTVTLTGLPADYQAAAGDMLSFAWYGSRALHMVVGDAQATAAGVLSVDVVPPVRETPAPTVGASVELVSPTCVMRLIPGTFSMPKQGREKSRASFEAVQVPQG